MRPPDNAKIIEGELATFWFDESGILCAIAKRSPRTIEKQKKNYELIKEISDNKKVCILSDTTSASPQDRENREYSINQLATVFKAMAIISDNAVGKFIANVFVSIKKQTPIPIKFFSDEKSAKEWLKNYL